MTSTEQGAALLRAILDAPDDDAARLVYADWLEDEGRAERAEFVRVSDDADWHDHWAAFCACRKEMIDEAASALGLSFRGFGREEFDKRRPYLRFGFAAGGSPNVELDLCLTIGRGFAERVRCPLAAWQAHGPAIARAHPVARAECTDAAARRSDFTRHYCVIFDNPSPPMCQSLQDYLSLVGWHDTKESCNAALSAALLAWAKATCLRCLGAGRPWSPALTFGGSWALCHGCGLYAPAALAR